MLHDASPARPFLSACCSGAPLSGEILCGSAWATAGLSLADSQEQKQVVAKETLSLSSCDKPQRSLV